MSDMDVTLAALREAVKLAPENTALLQHYIKTLVSLTRYDEAEKFLTDLLNSGRKSPAIQLALADVFYRQGKNSHALAIVETLANPNNIYPPALVMHAKLLYRMGSVDRAVQEYKRAIEHDETLVDTEFANLLGIVDPANEDADFSDSNSANFDDEVVNGRIRTGSDPSSSNTPPKNLEKPKIKFQDVGGMEGVKEQVRVKIIYPITHAEMYAAYGKKVGGGILLYGPPGCGKTYIARATAGEVNANFMSIGINDVLDMWLGNSERNLHQIFEQARGNRPCVLFFDEVDALGASRADLRYSGNRQLVNQFLSELDGVQSSNEGLLILGATNAPWHVDSAFRRPGRFDRVIFVPPPDQASREETLKILLTGKPATDVDIRKVAAKTGDFSGADLKAVVDAAIEGKLQEAIKTGKPTPLNTNDLLNALKGVRATTKEWFATARNHALYANQGGMYDEILEYMKLK